MLTENILNLIGNTPLVQFRGGTFSPRRSFSIRGEHQRSRGAGHAGGAERAGRLRPGAIIVEPTSGNMGIGMALVGRLKGYAVIIVMPEGMSEERKQLIRALGAELILTPAEESIGGAVGAGRQLAAADARVFVPQQFENPDNPRCHYETTAVELWGQMDGEIDAFVAGIGSGGTFQGVAIAQRAQAERAHCRRRTESAAALLGHEPGLHQIQGIGDGFIPGVLDIALVDDVVEVSDEDAIGTARLLDGSMACWSAFPPAPTSGPHDSSSPRASRQRRHRPPRPRRTLLQYRAVVISRCVSRTLLCFYVWLCYTAPASAAFFRSAITSSSRFRGRRL